LSFRYIPLDVPGNIKFLSVLIHSITDGYSLGKPFIIDLQDYFFYQ